MSALPVRLFLILATLLLGWSTFGSSSPWVGGLALLAVVTSTGLALGPRLAPSYSLISRALLGSAAFVAIVSMLGCLAYYTTNVSTALLFAVALLGLAIAYFCAQAQELPKLTTEFHWEELVLLLAGVISLAAWWYQVFLHNDLLRTAAVRTLWSIFDPSYLPFIALAIFCTLLLAWRRSPAALPLAIATVFSITSLAALLYPLGFGFDPFIHRATVEHIAQFGTITPKPLYYIGQYIIELVSVKLLHFDLSLVDALLVPTLFALLLPAAIAGRRHIFSLSVLFLVPFAAFVQTTPMALALVWTAVCVMLPRRPIAAPLIFALAALLTHPLAGIPAVMYVLLIALDEYTKQLTVKRVLTTVVVTASSLAIPLAFVMQAWQSGLKLNISWQHLFNLKQLPLSFFFSTRFNVFGDLAYTFIENHFLFIVTLAILTLVFVKYSWRANRPALLVACSMVVSFLILSLAFDFRFLISYERTDFALRLLSIATLFALPLLADGVIALKDKIKQSPSLILGLISLLAIAGSSFTYGAYPRHDNYARAAGFNVTEADISTVHAIENAADGNDYVVLSDQALSAAAVKEFGFAKYYSGDIFYYPIPTGGPLYSIYLDMVENGPTQNKIDQAIELTGSHQIYFAIHDYWWQSASIIEQTKTFADDWFTIGEPTTNAITVFVFNQK